MKSFSSWISLFASTGTLFCCALPSLFVVFGMGSTLAGMLSAFPQLIWISQYKTWVFGLSGFMICAAGYLHYRARFEACPVDPQLALACDRSRKWSLRLWILSLVLWLTGAFFAFGAPYVFS